MFQAYAIDNDLKYVDDKIRNYYEIGEYKTDDEMNQADVDVAADIEKPDANGRRSRSGRKSRAEVQAENKQKIADHMAAVDEAIDKATGFAISESLFYPILTKAIPIKHIAIPIIFVKFSFS